MTTTTTSIARYFYESALEKLAILEESGLFSVRITLVAMCLFAAFIIAMCIIKKKPGLLWFIPSSVFALGIYLCLLLASNFGTIAFEPTEPPTAVMEQALIRDYSFPDIPGKTEQLYADALGRSYSYELIGSYRIDKTHAVQTVKLEYLDLYSLIPDISSVLRGDLETLVETAKKQDVYNKDESFREDVLDELYHSSVKTVLEHYEDYMTGFETVLEADYHDGEWSLLPNDSLSKAFSGGVPAGDSFFNNAKGEALSGLTYIPKLYTIAEDADVAPAPNQEKFGLTQEAGDIIALIGNNPRLTEGKEPFFSTDCDFFGDGFHYYCDDTILTFTWKEMHGGHSCTFAEVYIADPSQFRRKLSADTYGSPIQKLGSTLADEANAVVAMNGDFYKFRNIGVTVYKRELYRFNPAGLELCHIDGKGDLIFTYSDELNDKEATEAFIKDNDILFTLAFGPVLVDNGEPHDFRRNYPLGQVTEKYSRSVIAQRDSCHYLLMTLNHGNGGSTATLSETQDILVSKGAYKAYELDGGQTAEIIMNGQILNHIDWGTERTVSDILYFATALPEDENY